MREAEVGGREKEMDSKKGRWRKRERKGSMLDSGRAIQP